MAAVQEYLDAFDRQLRTVAECGDRDAARTAEARDICGGRGFITYRDLGGAGSAAIS
jgi:hypothetical protein